MEESLAAVRGRQRADLASDLSTFIRFPIIAGIIVSALEIELAMAHLDADHLGALGGWALGAGIGLFLAGTIAAIRRGSGLRVAVRQARDRRRQDQSRAGLCQAELIPMTA